MSTQWFPETGTPRDVLLAKMTEMAGGDADWRGGKTWSLVYFAGEEFESLLKTAYTLFMSENGLSPLAFPSLRRFEAEVVSACLELFQAPEGSAGSMTSGGSESVLMAVKTARDHALKTRGITQPELLMPITAHPAFDKAAHYFGLKRVHVPVGPDYRVDLDAYRRSFSPNTALAVVSAPPYPHGVIDPIPEVAAMAKERNVLCHVDACLGGFIVPFARMLGRDIPPFDFAVDGVTSLSADLHKYGFAAKGASVVLYRTAELRRFQFFTYAGWPGGLYASPTMTGTRPGGAIAAAWATLQHFGLAGYRENARRILATTDALTAGVRSIPGLRLLGKPEVSVFAFDSDELDVYALGDVMEAKGWKLDRQQSPASLHLMVTLAHEPVVERFLTDLRESAASLKRGEPAPDGSAAMYGMVGQMPDKKDAENFLVDFMDGVYAL